MKKSIFFVLFCCLSILLKAQIPKVYINLVSHNEENYTYLSAPPSFYAVRPKIIQMAQLATVKGAKWHLGSDHIMLRAILKYDTGTVKLNTSGMNVLKFITTTYSVNVECDPHAHESVYNNADVAKLHDSLGVPPGKVMSGFLYNGLASGHDWQDYQNPTNGDVFPSYTWAPEILWGAATPGHTLDPQYYGIWKPQSMSNFLTNEPANHLINYGQGCKIELHDTSNINNIMSQLRSITNAIQSGAAPSTGFYCTSIFFREIYLNTPNFINVKMDDLMDSINVMVLQNKVEWLFIPEVINEWKTTYASQPFIMDCDLSIVNSLSEINSNQKSLIVYPNPANSVLNFSLDKTSNSFVTIEITDILGKVVLSEITKTNSVSLDKINSGIYFLTVKTESGAIAKTKFIKE